MVRMRSRVRSPTVAPKDSDVNNVGVFLILSDFNDATLTPPPILASLQRCQGLPLANIAARIRCNTHQKWCTVTDSVDPSICASLQDIKTTVEEVFRTIVGPLALALDETDTGGWYTCWITEWDEEKTMTPRFGFGVGEALGQDDRGRPKMALFQEVANEKVWSIISNDVESSWITRDPDNGKYGGGIRFWAGRIVFAFSGLAEWADEMLMLIAAWRLKLITREEILRITDISNNWRAHAYFVKEGVLAA